MKRVYAFLAEGFEEVEALMIVDLLRRTEAVDVVTVSITEELMVKGSHRINIMADKTIKEIDFDDGDMIFLPGGVPGTPNLEDCQPLREGIRKYYDEGKYLAAICAAPSIFAKMGLLKDKKATSYPTFEKVMDCKEYGGAVIVDENFITGKGLGVALEMGLILIDILVDSKTSMEVSESIQYDK